jgi:hypothetical protein
MPREEGESDLRREFFDEGLCCWKNNVDNDNEDMPRGEGESDLRQDPLRRRTCSLPILGQWDMGL